MHEIFHYHYDEKHIRAIFYKKSNNLSFLHDAKNNLLRYITYSQRKEHISEKNNIRFKTGSTVSCKIAYYDLLITDKTLYKDCN